MPNVDIGSTYSADVHNESARWKKIPSLRCLQASQGSAAQVKCQRMEAR
uniref:Uncharacterized protein n=1 Tax=Arundo donax TaxID=35708 RepID=A0A0A9AFH0_ARUDO